MIYPLYLLCDVFIESPWRPTDTNWITVSQPCVGHRQFWLNCCGCGVTGGMDVIWGEAEVHPSSSLCTGRPLHQRERASESAIVSAADLASFTPSQAPPPHSGHILPRWGHLTQRIWLFLESRFNEAWFTGRRETVDPACVWQSGRGPLGFQAP